MSFAAWLVLLMAGAFTLTISIGIFLLLVKLLSPALVLGLLFIGLVLAALIAWQTCCYLLATGLILLACLTAASTIALRARGSTN